MTQKAYQDNSYKFKTLSEKISLLADMPAELTQLDAWGLWAYDGDTKRNVPPFNANAFDKFLPFEEALELLQRGYGDGLSLNMSMTPYVCLDIDHMKDGEEDTVMNFADSFGWWEFSQSGEGLHCFIKSDDIGHSRKIKVTHAQDDLFDLDLIGGGLLFMTGDCFEDVSDELLVSDEARVSWNEIVNGLSRSTKTSSPSAPVQVSATAGRRFPDTRIEVMQSYLDHLPDSWCDGYGEWQTILQVLARWGEHDHYATPEIAREMGEAWSATSPNYDADRFASMWDSLDLNYSGGAGEVYIGTLKLGAVEGGWSPEVLTKAFIEPEHDEEGEHGEDVRDWSVMGQIRHFITTQLIALNAFDEADLPVNWAVIERAEPLCLVDNLGKKFHIGSNGSMVPITQELSAAIIRQAFNGDFVKWDMVTEVMNSGDGDGEEGGDDRFSSEAKKKSFMTAVAKAVYGEFWSVITRKRGGGSINFTMDMFAKGLVPSVERGELKYILPFDGFAGGDDESEVMDTDLVNRVVNDYIEHNPHLDDILDFIGYSRFAYNRKTSYMWLHAESDWGKTFLFGGVLGKLGIVAPISVKDIERALEGSPSGVSQEALLRHWVLFVDEFKTIKSEIKCLDDTFSCAPKNKMKFTVNTHAKVFTSAEMIASMVGEAGVEDQFDRRFVYLRCEGKLSDRALKAEVGDGVYTRCVRQYARGYLQTLVDDMCARGRVEAEREAEKWLKEYHDANRMSRQFSALDDSIVDDAETIAGKIADFCDIVVKSDFDPRGNYSPADDNFMKTLRGSVEKGVWKNSEVCCVTRMVKLCEVYMMEKYSKSELGKVSFKKNQLAKKVDEILFKSRMGVVTRWINERGLEVTTRGSLVG